MSKRKDELSAELEALNEAPVAGPPVDAEVAAMRADEIRRGITPDPVTVPKPKRQAADNEAVGMEIAHRLLAQEAEQRKATSDRRRGVQPAPGAARPVSVTPRRTYNETALGKDRVKPGYVSRWVRKYDDFGRPDDNPLRLQQFKDDGYEPVLDENGKEIHTRYGVLMQARPEDYAERIRRAMPAGAINPQSLAETTQQQVEQLNSQVGYRAAIAVGDGIQPDTIGPR